MRRNFYPAFWDPFSVWDENEMGPWNLETSHPSGLSIYEDKDFIYIEAALPGISSDEVDVLFDKGMIWIKAQKHEEKREEIFSRGELKFLLPCCSPRRGR